MKYPLRKRYLRELRQELGKYLVILILMVITIGFVSGFLIADKSIMTAIEEGYAVNRIEDGHLRTAKKMNAYVRRSIEEEGVTLYDLHYRSLEVADGSRIRVFRERKEVNLADVMSGTLPKSSGEIALDRMYAVNHNLDVGDMIQTANREYRITALVALPDYSSLFESNSDSIFDALGFGVACVTEEEFDALTEEITYCYAFRYDSPPGTEEEEKERGDVLLERIAELILPEEFIPKYQNQAIRYAPDDMGSDEVLLIALLYLIMGILAFVFGLTISDTIRRESGIIGTLRAMGYTKAELLQHYLVLPMTVTLLGAVLGNLLGYTVLKNVCANLYYNSYSLPSFQTVLNGRAFLLTTIIPMVLMLFINTLVLLIKLRISPLRFLRREIGGAGGGRAIPLSTRLPAMLRFRIRVLYQNIGSYFIMYVGIVFANGLLMFGLTMNPVLERYQDKVEEQMLSRYQYFLTVPSLSLNSTQMLSSLIDMGDYLLRIETEQEDAEKFSAYSLVALGGPYEGEEVTLYGVEPESRYVSLQAEEDEIYISRSYATKFRLEVGDEIVLKEKYENREYTLRVDGIYEYEAGLSVFMRRNTLNRIFDLGDDYFGGYFTDTPLTDIPEEYIDSVIDLETLTKINRQLEVSMGSIMEMLAIFSVLVYIIMIYLISKLMIEKHTFSISMTKILGYNDGEIASLYLHTTSFAVVLCMVLSLIPDYQIIAFLWREMINARMSGWLSYYLPLSVVVKMGAIGIGSYAVVAIYEMRKIRRIPMTMALKQRE